MSFSSSLFLGESPVTEGRQVFFESLHFRMVKLKFRVGSTLPEVTQCGQFLKWTWVQSLQFPRDKGPPSRPFLLWAV